MKYIIVLLVFLFFVSPSYAKLHIEPYGSVGGSYASSLSSPLFMTYALGGRLGYRFPVVSTGVDLFWTHYDTGSSSGSHSLVDVYHQSGSVKGFSQAGESLSIHHSEVSEHFQPFSIGAFAVVELPLLFDAYGTLFYTFGEKSTLNHHGYGVKAGVSFLSTFHFQFNVELQWSHYICAEGKVNCSKNFDIFSAIFSLSLPLSSDMLGSWADSTDSDDELQVHEEEG